MFKTKKNRSFLMTISLVLMLIILNYVNCTQQASRTQSVDFDPLRLLGLDPPFYQFWPYKVPTEGDIKKAYHKKSLLLHPDKNKSAKATYDFVQLTEAYKFLKGNTRQGKQRREDASERYAHYGEVMNGTLEFCRSLSQVSIQMYRRYYALLRREVKRFIYNPRLVIARYLDQLRSVSIHGLFWFALQSWFAYEIFGFIWFLIRKYIVLRIYAKFRDCKSCCTSSFGLSRGTVIRSPLDHNGRGHSNLPAPQRVAQQDQQVSHPASAFADRTIPFRRYERSKSTCGPKKTQTLLMAGKYRRSQSVPLPTSTVTTEVSPGSPQGPLAPTILRTMDDNASSATAAGGLVAEHRGISDMTSLSPADIDTNRENGRGIRNLVTSTLFAQDMEQHIQTQKLPMRKEYKEREEKRLLLQQLQTGQQPQCTTSSSSINQPPTLYEI